MLSRYGKREGSSATCARGSSVLGGHRASQKGCYERARERREYGRNDGKKRRRKRGREEAGSDRLRPIQLMQQQLQLQHHHQQEARESGPTADGCRTRKRMVKETMEMSEEAKRSCGGGGVAGEKVHLQLVQQGVPPTRQALGGHRTNHKGQKRCSERAKEATECDSRADKKMTGTRKKKETESSEGKPIEAVVTDDGIVQLTLSKPRGFVRGVKYDGVDDLLEVT
ncbi:hypothetical protein C4D60_Mb01t20910 [Musa balbisiana]|uniref:Uncharacterized protein n=1 Tax=Musa balbisiana TaxID=52838 RepID=A0A4S8JNU2_MUSBA|nr:hypothetical protein C4D60_Mb01t20910 [Musa balbisiana]